MSQPPPPSSASLLEAVVATIVVCHAAVGEAATGPDENVARLSSTLDALAAQTLPPAAVVGVVIGVAPRSRELLERRLGQRRVVAVGGDASFGDAVAAALAGVPTDPPGQWIWILHDDSPPDPGALAALVARADGSPSTWVVAPKVRDWDGRRLLEFGITVDRGGRRETRLERRELDQGQADLRTEALAAGTAGLLVRRSGWDRVGGLGSFGWPGADDIDLGWRIHAAGARVALTPEAVVRHAVDVHDVPDEGAQIAVRRARGVEVVLANVPPPLRLLLFCRFVLGAPVRALAMLLTRRPGEARIELAAARVVARDRRRVASAAATRQAGRRVPHREIRPQLAGFDDRVRRIRDSLRGYSSPAEGGSHRYVETGPVDEAAESLAVDDAAALRRWLGRPSVALFLVAAVLTLIAERHLLAGSLGGGRLVPAPDGASDLWRSYFAAFHPFGVGSAATAPPAIALLALLSSILLGHASVAVDLIVLGAVPLAALSAWWGSKAVVTATPLRLWAAASWAALPAVTGSVAGGRIDGCAAAMLIPVTGRVIAAAVRRNRAPGGWTRCFAAGLLLAVATAWAPAVWPLAGVAGAVVVVVLRGGWAVVRRRLAALGTVLVVGFLCCEPWSVALLRHPADIVAGLGIPEPAHTQPLDVARLMFFQPGGPGVPALWVGAALLLAAVVAAARRRPAVTAGLVVLVCGLTGALIVSRLHGIGTSAGRAWPGIELLVAAAGAITVAAAGAEGAQKVLARRSFGVVQPGIGVLAILVAAATGWADVSWVIHGAQGPVRADITATTPLFVGDALDGRDSPRAVVVDGRHPLAVALVRSARGDDLGTAADAAEVASPPSAGAAAATVRAAVADLVAGRSVATRELADSDIGYVVAEGPAAPAVRRGAAAIGGFGVTPSHGLTVLRAPGVTGELILTGGGTTALPASSDGTAVAQVSSAGRSRLLRLAEPASDRWVAELDGRALPRAAAGPLAAWTVPAGEAGTITVRWSSPSRTIWLIVELIVVVAVLLGSIPSPGAADARHRGAT